MARVSIKSVSYDTNCTGISQQEWYRRMKNRRKMSYKHLLKLVKQFEPELFYKIALDFYNPYEQQTYKTPAYLVLTHSSIEYFFTYTTD